MSNYEKARAGLQMIKDAILSELKHHPHGMTNAEVVNSLGLESDFEGGQRNYLSWSILGILLGEGKITMKGERRKRTYHVAS
jgi:hypothetical protein